MPCRFRVRLAPPASLVLHIHQPLLCSSVLQSSALRRLIPLGDRILVRRIEAVKQTAGGVFLPEATVKKANEAEVVEVGEGFRTEAGHILPVNVAIGDKVLLPEYGGTAVTVGDEEMMLYRDNDILGKYN